MRYKRLNFEDYFIICSDNYPNIETNLYLAEYTKVPYNYKGREFIAEYQVRYDESRNCIQAIFQQTKEKSDWKVNLDFPHKIYDKFTFDNKIIQLKVHGGWGTMWLAIQEKVRDAIGEMLKEHEDAFIEVFGWSLGSALATIASEDIYFKFGIKPYLYTFGSVKPFYGKKTLKYLKNCCEKAYNFYDHCDIVGYMVPFIRWFTFNHYKVKLEKKFCITKLFNPNRYHTNYHMNYLYDDIKDELV